MTDSNQGASLHASQQQASLDLALLVSLLEKAIAVNSQTSELSDNPQHGLIAVIILSEYAMRSPMNSKQIETRKKMKLMKRSPV
jgi:hypothetical protein